MSKQLIQSFSNRLCVALSAMLAATALSGCESLDASMLKNFTDVAVLAKGLRDDRKADKQEKASLASSNSSSSGASSKSSGGIDRSQCIATSGTTLRNNCGATVTVAWRDSRSTSAFNNIRILSAGEQVNGPSNVTRVAACAGSNTLRLQNNNTSYSC